MTTPLNTVYPAVLMNTTAAAPMNMTAGTRNNDGSLATASPGRARYTASLQASGVQQKRINHLSAMQQLAIQNQRLQATNNGGQSRVDPLYTTGQDVRQNQRLPAVNQRQYLSAAHYNAQVRANPHSAAGQEARQNHRLHAVNQSQHLSAANYNAPVRVNPHLTADQEARQNQHLFTVNHGQSFLTVNGNAPSRDNPRFAAHEALRQSQYLPGVQRTVSSSPSMQSRYNAPANYNAQGSVNPHFAAQQNSTPRFPAVINNNNTSQSFNQFLAPNQYGGQNQMPLGVSDYAPTIYVSVPAGHQFASQNQLSSGAVNMSGSAQAASFPRYAATMHARNSASINNMTPVRTGTPVNNMTPVRTGAPLNNMTPVSNVTSVNSSDTSRNTTPVRSIAPVRNATPVRDMTPSRNVAPARSMTPVTNIAQVQYATPARNVTPTSDTPPVEDDLSHMLCQEVVKAQQDERLEEWQTNQKYREYSRQLCANGTRAKDVVKQVARQFKFGKKDAKKDLGSGTSSPIKPKVVKRKRGKKAKARKRMVTMYSARKARDVRHSPRDTSEGKFARTSTSVRTPRVAKPMTAVEKLASIRAARAAKSTALRHKQNIANMTSNTLDVYHSYVDTTGFFYHDVILTRVDVTKNTNECIRLSMYETDFFPAGYSTHIGITHANRTSETEILANGTDYKTAFLAFRKAFKKYTRISWEQRFIDPAYLNSSIHTHEEQKRKALVFDKVGEQPESGIRSPSPVATTPAKGAKGAKQTVGHKRKDSCQDEEAEKAELDRAKRKRRKKGPLPPDEILTKEELESCKVNPKPFRYLVPAEGKARGDMPDPLLMGPNPVIPGDEPDDDGWYLGKRVF